MIRVRIVAVGKIREKFLIDGIAEYVKRAKRWADVTIAEVDDYAVKEGKAGAESIAMEREADAILPLVRGYCVALDIDGKTLSSPEFADRIGQAAQSSSDVTLVIGGSYGLSPRVKARADLRLSYGRVTFPHALVRLMTAEQVYRALSILNGHPYHK